MSVEAKPHPWARCPDCFTQYGSEFADKVCSKCGKTVKSELGDELWSECRYCIGDDCPTCKGNQWLFIGDYCDH